MIEINKLLFEELRKNNVKYCHWKSNNHLDKALEGKTDLDLFVKEDNKEKFREIVEQYGFIQVNAPKLKATYKVYDYLGFDFNTGKLTHLHIHYVIVLGEKYAKNYFLPLEEEFLNNNEVKDQVIIPNRSLELLILIIRMHIKLDWYSVVSFLKHKTLFPKQIMQEFEMLNKSFSQKDFLYYSTKLFNKKFEQKILNIKEKLETKNNSLIGSYRSKMFFKKLLKPYRREKGPSFCLKKIYLSIRYFKYVQRIKKTKKKTLSSRSISIAFVGADGSGKSTVTKDVIKWLSWKLEVEGLYLGIPKKSIRLNSISLMRRILSRFFSVFGSKTKKKTAVFFSKLQWILVGYKRKRIGRYITKSSQIGKVFIIDRYPLPIFDQMTKPMDRPRIFKINGKKNWLSVWEEKLYEEIPKPDKIVVLQADINTLRGRKTNTEINQHIEKADAVNSISADENVVLIDASKPYKEVLLQVKTKIWEILNELN